MGRITRSFGSCLSADRFLILICVGLLLSLSCNGEKEKGDDEPVIDAGSDLDSTISAGLEPGDLLITEVYLRPDFFTDSKYYANDEGMGPDGNPGYDSCDKFVEVVNVSKKKLDLDEVELFSKDNGVYEFSGVVLEPYEAVVIFYRHEECGNVPDLGQGVHVLELRGYAFVSADKPQISLKKGRVAIDRVYYDKGLPAGISLVRPDGLDASEFLNKGQVRLVKHPEAFCVSHDEEGRALAFSTGVCVDGQSFTSKCICDQLVDGDLGVTDVGDGDGGDVLQSGEVEPGYLLITEAYLKPDFYTDSKYYANDDNKGPDLNPGYDSCDKFVEIVNVTGERLSLNGVNLFSKESEIYDFSGMVLEGYEAVVVFYRHEEKCSGKDLPDLGEDIHVVGSLGRSFVTADRPQIVLKKNGVEIDRVYYDAGSPAGISLARCPEMDAREFLADGQVKLVKHPEVFCVNKEEGKSLAFSPGTCLNGESFVSRCECECEESVEDKDLGIVDGSEVGIGDSGGDEQNILQLDECVSLRIMEVYPSPSEQCERFIEIVREDAVTCSLEGIELYVEEDLKHRFSGDFLGRAVVVLSSPRQDGVCELPEGTDYVQYASSSEGQLGLSKSSGKTIVLRRNGVDMDTFVYEVNDYYEDYPNQSFVRFPECDVVIDEEVRVVAHKLHPCSVGESFSRGAWANGDSSFVVCRCDVETIPLVGQGDIVINEVYPVPKRFDVNGNGVPGEANCDEFVEVVMTGMGRYSLAGTSLCFNEEANEKCTFDSSHVLEQYEAIVIFSNNCDLPGWEYAGVLEENARVKLRLTNGEGNVLLMRGGNLVDIFSYPGEEVWTGSMQNNGYSFVRNPELTSDGMVLHPRAQCLAGLTAVCFEENDCAQEFSVSPGRCANQSGFEEVNHCGCP